MFKDTTFYHQHIRKAIIAFGTIFNNINIERKNSSGAVVQALRVPLAYSTKQKFLTRISRVPDAPTRGAYPNPPVLPRETTTPPLGS